MGFQPTGPLLANCASLGKGLTPHGCPPVGVELRTFLVEAGNWGNPHLRGLQSPDPRSGELVVGRGWRRAGGGLSGQRGQGEARGRLGCFGCILVHKPMARQPLSVKDEARGSSSVSRSPGLQVHNCSVSQQAGESLSQQFQPESQNPASLEPHVHP